MTGGCGVFVEKEDFQVGEDKEHYENLSKWENWKSFYFTLEGTAAFRLDKMEKVQVVFGNLMGARA